MFLIRKAIQEDYFNVLRLGDDQLGENYLKGVLRFSYNSASWVVVEKHSNDIIGFIYVLLENNKATIKSIAVHQGYQNKGVGTELINTVLKQLSEEVELFEVIAWERSDKKSVPLKKLLLKLGFKQTDLHAKYWQESSIRKGFTCPACGNPCECNAVIFSSPSSYS